MTDDPDTQPADLADAIIAATDQHADDDGHTWPAIIAVSVLNDMKARRSRSRVLVYVSVAVAVIAVAWAIYITITADTDRNAYDPLGDYPQQIVNTPQPIPASEAARIDVTGIKCNDAGQPVPVDGLLRWVRIDPPGFSVTAFEGSATRQPGCQLFNFQNAIPTEVIVDVAITGPSTWVIAGTDIPLPIDDRPPVPRRFVTDPIHLIPPPG